MMQLFSLLQANFFESYQRHQPYLLITINVFVIKLQMFCFVTWMFKCQLTDCLQNEVYIL